MLSFLLQKEKWAGIKAKQNRQENILSSPIFDLLDLLNRKCKIQDIDFGVASYKKRVLATNLRPHQIYMHQVSAVV